MRNTSILTTLTALGMAVAIPFTTNAAELNRVNNTIEAERCVVIDYQNANTSELEDIINNIQEEISKNCLPGWKVITIPVICKPNIVVPGICKPETDNNQPGTDNSKPETDNNQPGTDSSKPETDNNQPGTDSSKPETDNNQPGTDSSKPGTDNNQPGTDSSKPETDNNQPGTDNSKPETDNNQPGADSSKPGTDNNQPGTDSSKPGTDNNQPGATESSFAEQVVALVNAERAKAGLNPVTLDKNIEVAALIRARETETLFSHTRPNGSSFSSVLTENGISYRGAGENIAWGQASPEAVMNAWMNSSGHRANILNPNFTKIGVGYYQNAAGRNYWTQLFVY